MSAQLCIVSCSFNRRPQVSAGVQRQSSAASDRRSWAGGHTKATYHHEHSKAFKPHGAPGSWALRLATLAGCACNGAARWWHARTSYMQCACLAVGMHAGLQVHARMVTLHTKSCIGTSMHPSHVGHTAHRGGHLRAPTSRVCSLHRHQALVQHHRRLPAPAAPLKHAALLPHLLLWL